MRFLATIKVEIEVQDGTDKNALEAALQHGVSELRNGVQHRLAPASTGIESVAAEVSERFFDTD